MRVRTVLVGCFLLGAGKMLCRAPRPDVDHDINQATPAQQRRAIQACRDSLHERVLQVSGIGEQRLILSTDRGGACSYAHGQLYVINRPTRR